MGPRGVVVLLVAEDSRLGLEAEWMLESLHMVLGEDSMDLSLGMDQVVLKQPMLLEVTLLALLEQLERLVLCLDAQACLVQGVDLTNRQMPCQELAPQQQMGKSLAQSCHLGPVLPMTWNHSMLLTFGEPRQALPERHFRSEAHLPKKAPGAMQWNRLAVCQGMAPTLPIVHRSMA